jgi:3-hydroxymyristoyl/3-hydroxydecanoyl-(acyl carrier protein) dehydratase
MFELVRSARFEDRRAVGRARVPADLAFLADHFPGVPILPGSLQLELCAQIAGPLAEQVVAAEHGVERWAFLAMVRHAAFYRAVELPADLTLTAELRRVELATVVVAVTAVADGSEPACRGELVMAMREADPVWGAAIASARARVVAWKAAP